MNNMKACKIKNIYSMLRGVKKKKKDQAFTL